MTKPDFVYTTYIDTTPEKLWAAITAPEFLHQYWGDMRSDWKKGSKWSYVRNAGDAPFMGGEVLESVPPKKLVYTWAETKDPADVSRVTFEIETIDGMTRLTVLHGDFKAGSEMPGKISQGWPRVLSSLKSLLETGHPLAKKSCAA